ncbi:hypothetical protein STEG23_007454, partial [Scotinomys teguina]
MSNVLGHLSAQTCVSTKSKTLRESGLLGGKSVFVYCSRHKIRQPKKPDEFSAFRNNDSELRVEDQKTNGNRGVLTAPRGHSHRDVSRFFHCLLLLNCTKKRGAEVFQSESQKKPQKSPREVDKDKDSNVEEPDQPSTGLLSIWEKGLELETCDAAENSCSKQFLYGYTELAYSFLRVVDLWIPGITEDL